MVDFTGRPVDVRLELYLSQNNIDEFTVIPMTGRDGGPFAAYTCSFDIVQHGLLR